MFESVRCHCYVILFAAGKHYLDVIILIIMFCFIPPGMQKVGSKFFSLASLAKLYHRGAALLLKYINRTQNAIKENGCEWAKTPIRPEFCLDSRPSF